MKTKDFLKIVVDILDKKKAKNIKIIKIDKLTTLCDYFVVVDSDNVRHVKSLVDAVEGGLSFAGKIPRKIEKDVNFSWVILDYWDLVIHIFHKDTRKFYDLENIWADGVEVSANSIYN